MVCVGYVRKEPFTIPKDPDGLTMAEQKQRIQEYARSKDWRMKKTYSAKGADAGYENLKNDGLSHKFDIVAFYSLEYAGTSLSTLKSLVCHLFLPLQIQFAIVEDDFISIGKSREEIKHFFDSANCRLVHRKEIQEGRIWKGFSIGYGYKESEDGTNYAIDEEAAAVVRYIFEQRRKGVKPEKIAEELNQKSIPTLVDYTRYRRTGVYPKSMKKWNSNGIGHVLNIKNYLGQPSGIKHGLKSLAYPPIVSEEEWSMAHNQITSFKTHKRPELPRRCSIIDEETGQKLYLVQDKNGQDRYCSPKKIPQELSYENTGVRIDAVMKAVCTALSEEKAQAQKVKMLMHSQEAAVKKQEKIREQQRAMWDILMQANELEKKIVSLKNNAWEGIDSSDEELQMLLAKVAEYDAEIERKEGILHDLDIAFSEQNPWMEMFLNTEPEMVHDYKKYFQKIVVRRFEVIMPQIAQQKWRDYLPAEWLNGCEESYGTT